MEPFTLTPQSLNSDYNFRKISPFSYPSYRNTLIDDKNKSIRPIFDISKTDEVTYKILYTFEWFVTTWLFNFSDKSPKTAKIEKKILPVSAQIGCDAWPTNHSKLYSTLKVETWLWIRIEAQLWRVDMLVDMCKGLSPESTRMARRSWAAIINCEC